MSKAKILVLVIYNPSPIYDAQLHFWRQHIKSYPDISVYFVTFGNVNNPVLEGDILTVPGTESYLQIIHKTVVALEYFLDRDSYDYIIRTNMSSIWDFKQLREILATLPSTGVYAGNSGVDWWKAPPDRTNIVRVQTISGSGIVMTPDVCRKLLDNRRLALEFQIIDDVDIGYTMGCLGVPVTDGVRCDIEKYPSEIPIGFYHYRVRFPDDLDDRIKKTLDYMETIRSEIESRDLGRR